MNSSNLGQGYPEIVAVGGSMENDFDQYAGGRALRQVSSGILDQSQQQQNLYLKSQQQQFSNAVYP
jgi:hypothetical protein